MNLGADGDASDSDVWYLDMGAKNHMTGCCDVFELDRGITGCGSILFTGKNSEHKLLTGVYWIPKLKNNIISVGQLDEHDSKVLIENEVLASRTGSTTSSARSVGVATSCTLSTSPDRSALPCIARSTCGLACPIQPCQLWCFVEDGVPRHWFEDFLTLNMSASFVTRASSLSNGERRSITAPVGILILSMLISVAQSCHQPLAAVVTSS